MFKYYHACILNFIVIVIPMKHLEMASSRFTSLSSAVAPDVELPFSFSTFDGLMLGVLELSGNGRFLHIYNYKWGEGERSHAYT